MPAGYDDCEMADGGRSRLRTFGIRAELGPAGLVRGNLFGSLLGYLNGVLGFIGITPEFVHADGVAVGPEQREAGIANGLAEVEKLAA